MHLYILVYVYVSVYVSVYTYIYIHTTKAPMPFRCMEYCACEFCTQSCDLEKSGDSELDASESRGLPRVSGFVRSLRALRHRCIEEFGKLGFWALSRLEVGNLGMRPSASRM